MIVIGIDPGVNTGVATYEGGKLTKLETIAPVDLHGLLESLSGAVVVFEDSRLQTNVWIPSKSKAVASTIARKIGMVDAWCHYIEARCKMNGIEAIAVSPKGKGAKTTSDTFKDITGWTAKSNQHERDAAMVAYRFRSK